MGHRSARKASGIVARRSEQGAKGEQGKAGPAGPTGPKGDTPRFTVGNKVILESHDGRDPQPKALGSGTNRFCSLERVAFRDIDSANETTMCEVYLWQGTWYLKALSDGDADAWCDARCISW